MQRNAETVSCHRDHKDVDSALAEIPVCVINRETPPNFPESLSSLLDWHAHRLRAGELNKLEEEPINPRCIETVCITLVT